MRRVSAIFTFTWKYFICILNRIQIWIEWNILNFYCINTFLFSTNLQETANQIWYLNLSSYSQGTTESKHLETWKSKLQRNYITSQVYYAQCIRQMEGSQNYTVWHSFIELLHESFHEWRVRVNFQLMDFLRIMSSKNPMTNDLEIIRHIAFWYCHIITVSWNRNN